MLLLWWLGCDSACEEAARVDATCDVGTGQGEFLPLEDGALLPVDSGGQGGQHVYGSLALTGILDRGRPLVDFELLVGDTAIAGYRNQPRKLFEQGGMVFLLDETVIFEVDPGTYNGVEALLRASVTDTCERTVEGENTVIIDAQDYYY